MSTMKVYRHNCARRHRNYRTLAACMFPRAEWVVGEGAYASLAWCRPLTIELHETFAEAEAAKTLIDAIACGHTCTRRHEIVRLER